MRIRAAFGISRLKRAGRSGCLTCGTAGKVGKGGLRLIKWYLYAGFCTLFICSSCTPQSACNRRSQRAKTNFCFFLLLATPNCTFPFHHRQQAFSW